MKVIYAFSVVGAFALMVSCRQQPTELTEEEKKQIVDSVTLIAGSLIKNGTEGIEQTVAAIKRTCSADPDARHISSGLLFTSVDVLIDSVRSPGNATFKSMLEIFEETFDRVDAVVLSREAVSLTIPARYTMKLKNGPTYNGSEVMTFLFQKRKGKWMIIQSHISEYKQWEAFNTLMPEVFAAMIAPKNESKK
ncbi:MAG TPA: hypothetical protein PLR06_04150 [Cyclobacteriaceae bacterium]|nr:hypothetical protein [Cyclobacteriaceae bacterium]